MNATYLTLQQITERLLSELLRSRTDFLLLQAQVWKTINDSTTNHDAYVQPTHFDVDKTTFEFFITQQAYTWIEKIIHRFRKMDDRSHCFRLCNHDEKAGIKVTISICQQSETGKEFVSDVRTEPQLTIDTSEVLVTGMMI